jgi:hypothetical protein
MYVCVVTFFGKFFFHEICYLFIHLFNSCVVVSCALHPLLVLSFSVPIHIDTLEITWLHVHHNLAYFTQETNKHEIRKINVIVLCII